MEFFGKNKGKKSPDTRGLSDYHPVPYLVSTPNQPSTPPSLVSVPNHVSTPVSSSLTSSSNPPVAVPYNSPGRPDVNVPIEVKFFAGGNENKEGEQEIEEVDVCNTSNGVVSPIFSSKGGKFDIVVGKNINGGLKQKIGPVKFGNAG
ncbi:uncharacterized protein LOC141614815 [Silene latifolia]|uniref:uncharacterized protein LOC141614815 n=1 Tax=Silene latifolia TaxID=37657 RepID=UPI003D787FA2